MGRWAVDATLPPMRAKGWGLAGVLACALLAGCGGATTGAGPGGSSSSGPGSSSSSTASGPATEDIALTGDATISGPLSRVNISCSYPTLDGLSIQVSGVLQATAGTPFVFVNVRDGVVSLREATGSGQQYTERDFSGSGTHGFDATRGVRLSGGVTDSTPASTSRGTLGAITAISGSISCGGQTTGTSTITVSGTTADGAVDLHASPVKVVCSTGASGEFIGITGLTTINGQRAVLIVSLGQSSLSVATAVKAASGLGAAHFYTAQGKVGTTLSATGGHVDGNASETATAGGHTVRVSGDATCGATATY